MTSEIDVFKTNEFLRRRKLRLQQVREQSKDIAKKLRQRAKAEKLRQTISLDAKKEKEYYDLQENFVGRLEKLYSQSLQNVGSSHKNATEAVVTNNPINQDISKLRGKEAVTEVRKRKQQKLDEQKKILERKLQAREAANEISREKFATVAKILKSKSEDNIQKTSENFVIATENQNNPVGKESGCKAKNDMATQWEVDELPNEWVSSVPMLSIPKNDKDSLKNSDNEKEKPENIRLNLFALSDEMPSSLRGGLSNIPSHATQQRSSVTLVSEYLQTRNLRLRESAPISAKKSDDLLSLKQTILRNRASKTDGNLSNICHVLNKQLIPVPSWTAEDPHICGHCHRCTPLKSQIQPVTKVFIKKTNARSMNSSPPWPALKDSRSHKTKIFKTPVSGKSDKTKSTADTTLNKKKSVTMYNHSTRDAKQSYDNEALVVREQTEDENAYIKALKEMSVLKESDNFELEKKKEEMRNKVAVTREKVDKEYKDTLAFLNSLTKDKSCRSHNASHLDYDRQQMQNDKRQKEMQDEFKRIEKDCSKRICKHKNKAASSKKRSARRSPEESERPPRDFQYDWMPVPEADDNLVVHSIPNGNHKNNVKFNDVDTYHEYRSRHKHTPPTKETHKEKKRVVETLVIEQESSDTTEGSLTSNSASLENLATDKSKDNYFLNEPRLSDGDRIVIYRILDSKKDRKRRDDKKSKAINKIFKATSVTENDDKCVRRDVEIQDNTKNTASDSFTVDHGIALESLNEGVYRVEENGDNIASTYFSAGNDPGNVATEQQTARNKSVTYQNAPGFEGQQRTKNTSLLYRCTGCKCSHRKQEDMPSAGTSTCSFQTASKSKGAPSDAAFVQLLDDGGQEAGKFYIGASGFLKDDNYEVVIQLKKKESEKLDSKSQEVNTAEEEPLKNLTKVDTEVQSSFIVHSKESAAQTSIDPETEKVQEEVGPLSGDVLEATENVPTECEASLGNECIISVDKNVNTTFQDSYVIPESVPKSEPTARPATSTYTQTSFSSPNSRPVFMHMTSSTSTAYMSPPDFILPHFLRQNRVLRPEDDFVNDSHVQNGDSFRTCQCSHKVKQRKCRYICSTTDTPPNTARSDELDGSTAKGKGTETPKHKHKSKVCRKKQKLKSDVTLHRGSSSAKSIHAPHSTKSVPKGDVTKEENLNPVLKKYVNKLLALNREGLKAIQVIDQDCSAVDTPSSSIINTRTNVTEKSATLGNKISLEQIKIMLEQQIVNKYTARAPAKETAPRLVQNTGTPRPPRRRRVHKVKSLNISRHLFRNNHSSNDSYHQSNVINANQHGVSSSWAPPQDQDRVDTLSKEKGRSKSSPTPRSQMIANRGKEQPHLHRRSSSRTRSEECYTLRQHHTFDSTDSEKRENIRPVSLSHVPPTDISTQTSGIDSEIHFMKLAENKLENMEKIADLTEKCTKRLSNLAKVLEEVRKNKSLVYSHVSTSDTASDSEPKRKISSGTPKELVCRNGETQEKNANLIFDVPYQEKLENDFTPLLSDIPKPLTPLTLSLSTISERSNVASSSSVDQTKHKARPPPALSRIHLKTSPDNIVVPHELSTVMEVDSPMSAQLKNQSTRRDLYQESVRIESSANYGENQVRNDEKSTHQTHPEIHINNKANPSKTLSITSDDTKMEMMDMKLFNDIMLQPFVSLQEYAKQCHVPVEDPSQMENLVNNNNEQGDGDNIGSLHSDSSLPDVISELLKRKLISEPFKFDTASHVTTSMSSESSISLLALSNMYRAKRKLSKHVAKKENMAETSETLSISSNPDLENAFQKLGMGWASSTLKKTKERLALSSSSNTSSSSYSQLKFKSFNREPPTLATDSSLSELNDSNMNSQNKNDNPKNAIQQTSLTNSMTVKEFLTNELAKKITFTNKSGRNVDEFVSLYETKMPEELKNVPEKSVEGEHSVVSQATNRVRTSTPVQLFKSTTYHTTSSSNTSNGLFSNAEELSSVKVTSTSVRNHSMSDKDDLTIPNYSLKRKGSDNSKSA